MKRPAFLACCFAVGAAIGWVWAGRKPVGWDRAGEPEVDEYVSARWS